MFQLKELPHGRVCFSMNYTDSSEGYSTNHSEGLWVNCNQQLISLLGLPAALRANYVLTGDTGIASREEVCFPRVLSQVNVHCDIVQKELSGAGLDYPLLFSSTELKKPKQGQIMQTISPVTLSYKRIVKSSIDQMSFRVVDQSGENIDFSETLDGRHDDFIDNVHLRLHFRKRGDNVVR
jgi:hypothetical protein